MCLSMCLAMCLARKPSSREPMQEKWSTAPSGSFRVSNEAAEMSIDETIGSRSGDAQRLLFVHHAALGSRWGQSSAAEPYILPSSRLMLPSKRGLFSEHEREL